MDKGDNLTRRLRFEGLEPRLVLSLTFGAEFSDHHNPGHPGGPPGGGGPNGGGDQIDLPTVAAHEFGHSLGLPHTNSGCGVAGQPLMCPFYIGEAFALQQADIDAIRALYPDAGFVPSDGTWADINGTPNTIDVTYSYTPDGTSMDKGKSTLFKTMNNAFDSEATWKGIFADAVQLWADATSADNGSDGDPSDDIELVFGEVTDDGRPTGAAGAGQNEEGIGDIRIGAHAFPKGVLAHAATLSNFDPNGTDRGDAHFSKGVSWADLRGTLSASTSGVGNSSGGGGGHGRFTAMSYETADNTPEIVLLAARGIPHLSTGAGKQEAAAPAPDYSHNEMPLPAANVDQILADSLRSSHERSPEELEFSPAESDHSANVGDPLFEDTLRLLTDVFNV